MTSIWSWSLALTLRGGAPMDVSGGFWDSTRITSSCESLRVSSTSITLQSAVLMAIAWGPWNATGLTAVSMISSDLLGRFRFIEVSLQSSSSLIVLINSRKLGRHSCSFAYILRRFFSLKNRSPFSSAPKRSWCSCVWFASFSAMIPAWIAFWSCTSKRITQREAFSPCACKVLKNLPWAVTLLSESPTPTSWHTRNLPHWGWGWLSAVNASPPVWGPSGFSSSAWAFPIQTYSNLAGPHWLVSASFQRFPPPGLAPPSRRTISSFLLPCWPLKDQDSPSPSGTSTWNGPRVARLYSAASCYPHVQWCWPWLTMIVHMNVTKCSAFLEKPDLQEKSPKQRSWAPSSLYLSRVCKEKEGGKG